MKTVPTRTMKRSKPASTRKQKYTQAIPQSAYSNACQIQGSPFDFKLIFGEIIQSDGGVVLIEPKANIVVSPTHAKALLEALQTSIRTHEEKFGEITCKRPSPLLTN